MINELPFWHDRMRTIFYLSLILFEKYKKNNIIINDRIIGMKKILFLIGNKIFEQNFLLIKQLILLTICEIQEITFKPIKF